MNNTKPVRCQKCGKPLGYVTVLAKGLTSFQQPIQNLKIVAICMECFQKKVISGSNWLKRTDRELVYRFLLLAYATVFHMNRANEAWSINE
jgi:hypothetical protein